MAVDIGAGIGGALSGIPGGDILATWIKWATTEPVAFFVLIGIIVFITFFIGFKEGSPIS